MKKQYRDKRGRFISKAEHTRRVKISKALKARKRSPAKRRKNRNIKSRNFKTKYGKDYSFRIKPIKAQDAPELGYPNYPDFENVFVKVLRKYFTKVRGEHYQIFFRFAGFVELDERRMPFAYTMGTYFHEEIRKDFDLALEDLREKWKDMVKLRTSPKFGELIQSDDTFTINKIVIAWREAK